MKGNEKQIDVNIDDLLLKLLSLKGNKVQKQSNIQENDIKFIIIKAKEILMDQPVFLELESPLNVCGDIHGQFPDFITVFEKEGYPTDKLKYVNLF